MSCTNIPDDVIRLANEVRGVFEVLAVAVERARERGLTVQYSCVPVGSVEEVVARPYSVRIENISYPASVSL